MAKSDNWLTKESLEKIFNWSKSGLTDEQIAKNMGISKSTFYNWQKEYPEFLESIKKGKEISDRHVENALFKNATGHDYVEEVVANRKTVKYKDGKRVSEVTEPVAVQVKKFKPPETTAQIFWLKNRKSSEWKDKQRDGVHPEATDQAAVKSSKVANLVDYAKRKM